MSKQLSAGEMFAQEIMGNKLKHDIEKLGEFGKKSSWFPSPYHRIAGILVDVDNLKMVLTALVDEWENDAFDQSVQTGVYNHSMSDFFDWLDIKYFTKEEEDNE